MKNLMQRIALLFAVIFYAVSTYAVRTESVAVMSGEPKSENILVPLLFPDGIASCSGYFDLWSSNGDYTVTLGNSYKNMILSGDNILLYRGKSVSDYKLSAPAGYVISSYGIVFSNGNASCDMTLSAVGRQETVTCQGSEHARMEVTGINENETYISVASSGNQNEAAVIEYFIVAISPSGKYVPGPAKLLFSSNDAVYPYRIPAMAVTRDSSVIVASDYRPCKADIGAGDVDVHIRISRDNAATWSEERKILNGSGSGNTAGYGDVAMVADRESDKVLMVVATGDVIFGRSGTFLAGGRKMRMAYVTSEDNGNSWSSPKDITDDIYGKMDVLGAFFTSGRILQSSVIKKEDYYRIYSVLCTNSNTIFNGANCNNFVFYSDDFGENWYPLGGCAIYGGNEAKCEELPDGNLLVSSRRNGGRKFNIFKYTDSLNAEGEWGTAVESDDAGSIISGTADCNGEILVADAVRNSDGYRTKILLQSVPVSSERAKVGIFYKELGSASDYATPQDVARDWKGPYLVSNTFSAYSTMCVQPDNYIGFFFEETEVGEGYQMKYRKLSLDEITDGEYSITGRIDVGYGEHRNIGNVDGVLSLELEADRDGASSVSASDTDVRISGMNVVYHVKPGEWTLVSFPADIDLRESSDIESSGYVYGEGNGKCYTVASLDFTNPESCSLVTLDEPVLLKNRCYAVRFSDNGSSVISFKITVDDSTVSDAVNNVTCDLSSCIGYDDSGSICSGINTVGNPYLSVIDLSVEGAAEMKDISRFVYKYDYATDTFIPYDLYNVSQLSILPFSTFVVHSTSENSQLSITPKAKTAGEGKYMQDDGIMKRMLVLGLFQNDSVSICDRTVVSFSSGGSNDFVAGEDAVKLWGGLNGKSSELATSEDGVYYAVNDLALESCEIPLVIRTSAGGNFIISREQIEGFDEHDTLVLYDMVENTEYDLLGNNYGCRFVVDDSTDISERFVIRFVRGCGTGLETVGEDNIKCAVDGGMCRLYGMESCSSVMLYDMAGHEVYRGSGTDVEIPLDKGCYIVKVCCDGVKTVKRIAVF